MAEILQIVCDNEKCGAVKKAENHWWMLWIDDEGELHLRPMRGTLRVGVLTFCGEPCAMKKLSEFMSGGNGQQKDNQRQTRSSIGVKKVIDLLAEGQCGAKLSLVPVL